MSTAEFPAVSLLLPNRNNEPVLDLALERLATHTTYPNFELIVVDDGSTDRSLDILKRWRAEARFEHFTLLVTEHAGVGAALNRALEHAGGDIAVSLDGDATIETPGWLERMVAFQRSDPRIGVVTPAVTHDTGRVHARGINLVCAEGLHDGTTQVKEPVGRRTLHVNVERPRAADVSPVAAEVDAALGVGMLFPRALARELGDYDLGFAPVWFEDLDLSLSMRRLDAKVFCLPEVNFLHRGSLRNVRETTTAAGLMRSRARRALGRVVSQPVKDVLIAAARLNRVRPEQRARMEHHYRYWREKWGFDLLNPDMDEIARLYGSTEVCWATNPDRRRAGEDILRQWELQTSASAGRDSTPAGSRVADA